MTTFEEIQKAKILGTYNLFAKPDADIIIKAKELSESPKFKKVMGEWKEGALTSSSGEKVTDQKQALAIAFSEAQKVEKAEESLGGEMVKGGQGSGRKKTQITKYDSIGKTKSGKNVYGFFNHPDHEDFSAQDHLDAAKLHQNEKNPKIDVNHYDYHHQTGEFHKEAAQKVNKSEENNNGLVNKGEIDGVLTLLNKSLIEEIDIKKAEGSRGGKVIGHTRSGKPIYDSAEHESHKDFTKEDHKDASRVHGLKLYDFMSSGESPNKEKYDYHKNEEQKHNKLKLFGTVNVTKKKPGEGHIIGKTSSGKKIYDSYNHPSHKDFNDDDHLEAWAAHKERGRYHGEGEFSRNHHDTQAALHDKHYNLSKYKQGLTSYGNKAYGKQKQEIEGKISKLEEKLKPHGLIN